MLLLDFLGLSRSFFVRLMVLYFQSMIFTCISHLIVVESLFWCWLSKKKIFIYYKKLEQSFPQKM